MDYVPVFIVRIPVHYYLRPPAYFRAWHRYQPPRWGERRGRDWKSRHPDWHRQAVAEPPPASRPDYQRCFRGRDYPAPVRQRGCAASSIATSRANAWNWAALAGIASRGRCG